MTVRQRYIGNARTVAPRVLAATVNVGPNEDVRTWRVWISALEETPWRTKAAYPGRSRVNDTFEKPVSIRKGTTTADSAKRVRLI